VNTRKRFITMGGFAGFILVIVITVLVIRPWQLFRQINALDIGSTKISEPDGMTLVFVPAGDFLMGSDKSQDASAFDNEFPQHSVYLDAFWIDSTEVTNAMFAKFVAATQYKTDAEKKGNAPIWEAMRSDQVDGAYWQHPLGPSSDLTGLQNYPVVQVSWNDAQAYCEWAGRRLPTEAEWEKAARGTDGRLFPWGNQPPTGELVNFADKHQAPAVSWANPNEDDGYELVSPAGNYPAGASPYGALDMAGNVWEWTADWYGQDYYAVSPTSNPVGPSTGDGRVVRGGSWTMDARGVRTTFRAGPVPADYAENNIGFRCAQLP
jgi:formylglycine-generating enzyme required for sulfatase activity